MPAPHREDLIQQFLDMINKRDLSLLDAFTAVEHIDHNPAVPDGIEANRAFWAEVFTGFPDIQATLHTMLVDGDLIAGRFEYSGTHLGPFLAIPATGRHVTISTMDIFRIEDGLIAEHWDETTMPEVLRELAAAAGSDVLSEVAS